MLISISEAAIMRKLSFSIFVLCVLISINNQNAEKRSSSIKWLLSPESDAFPAMLSSESVFLSVDGDDEVEFEDSEVNKTFEYDYYRDSCPQAEEIIRSVVKYLHKVRSDVGPALLRLLFHDCFIEVVYSYYITFSSFAFSYDIKF